MQTQRVKIFFEDEAPRLGCGWPTQTYYLNQLDSNQAPFRSTSIFALGPA